MENNHADRRISPAAEAHSALAAPANYAQRQRPVDGRGQRELKRPAHGRSDACQDARLRRPRETAHGVQWDDRHGPGKGRQSQLWKILARATRGRSKDEPARNHPLGAGRPQDFARKGNPYPLALPSPHSAPPCLCTVDASPGTGSPQRPGAGANPPSHPSDPPRGTQDGLVRNRIGVQFLYLLNPLYAVLQVEILAFSSRAASYTPQ
jgi:hypothetical protein